ncbi:MAG: ribonuclease D [Wenzhouxiangella sp.]
MPIPTCPATEAQVQQADLALATAQILTTEDRAEHILLSWADEPAVGLDTEFVRERTFFPLPGLVQASNGREICLLDAVALPQMPALSAVLNKARQVKILHSVGEDLEVLKILCGVLPQPLFDTQIAAAMLGSPLQTRYEHLIAEVFNVELPGGKARSDWRKRPLTKDLTTYAAQDVIWLPRLHQVLSEALERADRLAWLMEDCERLVNNENARDAEPAVLRVKGAGNLSDEALERLERLAQWRESEARRRDLPRSFVVRDEVLMPLAASTPGTARDQLLRALPPPVQRRYGDQLNELLEQSPRGDFRRPLALLPMGPGEREAIKEAQTTVNRIAGELQIDPALLASRREIAKVFKGERPTWTQGWRRPLLAEALPI